MTTSYEGGFASPSHDAARAFRSLMNAMAKPGRPFDISGATGPMPMSDAAAATILTLCDPETPLALMGAWNCDDVRNWVTFHTGAPLVNAARAMFVLGDWASMMPLDQFNNGDPQYPDRSATLIIECTEFTNEAHELSGPGIQTTQAFDVPDLSAFQSNAAQFPLGLDFVFCTTSQVAAVPRSTQLQEI